MSGNDLALLKVDAGDGLEITVVPLFADIDDVRIGDPVGALGAPFGLPNTLTVGIISALDRLAAAMVQQDLGTDCVP